MGIPQIIVIAFVALKISIAIYAIGKKAQKESLSKTDISTEIVSTILYYAGFIALLIWGGFFK